LAIILTMFTEIGSYLTDKEHKISWCSFFLRHGVCKAAVLLCNGLKVKGPDIYIPPLTGKREQQRFTN